MHFNLLCFSQRMIFFPSTTMKKTSGIGRIVSERNIFIKKMPKLRGGRRHLLEGKDRNAKKREPEKKKATRSFTGGCRRSTKSIWDVEPGKRRRLGRLGSAGTRRAVPRPSRGAPQQAAPSWATATSPGRRREAPWRRCWTWCCTAWTGKTCRRSGKCSASSRRCGTRTSLLSAARLGWRRRTASGSWVQSRLCHRSSTAWPRVWRINSLDLLCWFYFNCFL